MENVDIIIPKNKEVFVIRDGVVMSGKLLNISYIKSCDKSENELYYKVEMYDSGVSLLFKFSQIFELEETANKYLNQNNNPYPCIINERFSKHENISFNVGFLNYEVKSFSKNSGEWMHGKVIKIKINVSIEEDVVSYDCVVRSMLTDNTFIVPFYNLKFNTMDFL